MELIVIHYLFVALHQVVLYALRDGPPHEIEQRGILGDLGEPISILQDSSYQMMVVSWVYYILVKGSFFGLGVHVELHQLGL